jgi:hypothetical protein
MPVDSGTGIAEASVYTTISLLSKDNRLELCSLAASSLDSLLIIVVYGVVLSQGGKWKCRIGSRELVSTSPRIEFLIRSNWVALVALTPLVSCEVLGELGKS